MQFIAHKKQITNRLGFISVGAVCQRFFQVCFAVVVSSVLGLSCLVKRKLAMRGRNLPRDSRAGWLN